MAWVTYYSMEFTPLVALRPSLGILGLSGAVLPEVLCSLRGHIREELHLDTTQRLS